ncbi:MAG: copper chaperone PCu(A)C [Candidatus Eisenbacteria bacterium]|nr:copper chaperone PCu(A)C [Candidatus Eisenbacteria bacterium]
MPVSVALALMAAAALPGCGPRGGSQLKGSRPAQGGFVGHVSVQERRGSAPARPFAFRASPGHVLYVFFGYATCPDICPATLGSLRKALAMLGGDAARVEVAMVTVDAARDSGDVLARYLASFVDSAHALVPETQEQLALAETVFGATSSVTRQPGGQVDVSHTASSYLVDSGGRVVVVWEFGTKPADLAHDIRVLLGEQAGRPAEAGPEVSGPWARATPAGATAAAVYLALRSDEGDTLRAVSVEPGVAAAAQLHRTLREAGGEMSMVRVDAVPLPAGVPVDFRPGGDHVMLVGLAKPLTAGDTLDVRLYFAKEKVRRVRVPVREE